MKIEIELSEDLLQQRITQLLTHSTTKSPSYMMRQIVEELVREEVKKRIREDYKIKLSDEIRELIQSESDRYAHKKLPGWIARRVQEMLESVRKQFDN